MTNELDQIIEKATSRIDEIDALVSPLLTEQHDLRVTVNSICKLAGRPQPYPQVQGLGAARLPAVPGTVTPPLTKMVIKNDMFTGMGLATAAAAVLAMRFKEAGTTAPTSVDDLYETMLAGGFQFLSKDAENQKRGLAVSLAKNTKTFRRVANGLFGLSEWYPTWTKRPRKTDNKPVPLDLGGALDEKQQEEGQE